MKVAVYGTLRYGMGNWEWFLKDKSKHIGRFRVEGYVMLGKGLGFPYIARKEGAGEIVVDVFEVDWEVLRSLDGLEGVSSGHYARRMIEVEGVVGSCFIYEVPEPEREKYLENFEGREIESGDWVKEVEKNYGVVGSGLEEENFEF